MIGAQAPELLPKRRFDTMDVSLRAAEGTALGWVVIGTAPGRRPRGRFDQSIGSLKMRALRSPVKLRLTLALNEFPK